MAFDSTPNSLESSFATRDATNNFYEGVHISGSNLVIYHDETGLLTADKVSVWATKYGIGGLSISASWASSSISASYVPNLYPQVAQITVPSASWVSASVFITTAQTASYVTASNVIGTVSSASLATTASYINAINVVGVVASASYVFTSSYETTVEISSSWASASLSSSYSLTSSYALNISP